MMITGLDCGYKPIEVVKRFTDDFEVDQCVVRFEGIGVTEVIPTEIMNEKHKDLVDKFMGLHGY